MKNKDIEKLAEKIYDDFVGHDIWEEAYKTYPDYNGVGEDTDNATEMILNFILDNTQKDKKVKKLSDDEEAYFRQCLYESIFAGLT